MHASTAGDFFIRLQVQELFESHWGERILIMPPVCMPVSQTEVKTKHRNAKCIHGRERAKCKDCGGVSICSHGRQRSQCFLCQGGSICSHGKLRSRCKDCGGEWLFVNPLTRSFSDPYSNPRRLPMPAQTGKKPMQRMRGRLDVACY